MRASPRVLKEEHVEHLESSEHESRFNLIVRHVHLVAVASGAALVVPSVMQFLQFILRLAEAVGDIEAQLLPDEAAQGHRTAGVAVDGAAVDRPEESALGDVGALVDFQFVLAHHRIAARLHY